MSSVTNFSDFMISLGINKIDLDDTYDVVFKKINDNYDKMVSAFLVSNIVKHRDEFNLLLSSNIITTNNVFTNGLVDVYCTTTSGSLVPIVDYDILSDSSLRIKESAINDNNIDKSKRVVVIYLEVVTNNE